MRFLGDGVDRRAEREERAGVRAGVERVVQRGPLVVIDELEEGRRRRRCRCFFALGGRLLALGGGLLRHRDPLRAVGELAVEGELAAAGVMLPKVFAAQRLHRRRPVLRRGDHKWRLTREVARVVGRARRDELPDDGGVAGGGGGVEGRAVVPCGEAVGVLDRGDQRGARVGVLRRRGAVSAVRPQYLLAMVGLRVEQHLHHLGVAAVRRHEHLPAVAVDNFHGARRRLGGRFRSSGSGLGPAAFLPWRRRPAGGAPARRSLRRRVPRREFARAGGVAATAAR